MMNRRKVATEAGENAPATQLRLSWQSGAGTLEALSLGLRRDDEEHQRDRRYLLAKAPGAENTSSLLPAPTEHGIPNCFMMTATQTEEYLTIKEAAGLLKVSPKRVRNLMCSGVLKQGVHFFRPSGLGPRFKLSALEA
jgi:hypothetical protein